jgi:hypothetical protein
MADSDSDWDDWADFQLAAAPGNPVASGAEETPGAADAKHTTADGESSESESDWDEWASSMLEAAPGVAQPQGDAQSAGDVRQTAAAALLAGREGDETAATLAQAAAALAAYAGPRGPAFGEPPHPHSVSPTLPAGGDYWALLGEHGAQAAEASLVLPDTDPVWATLQAEAKALGSAAGRYDVAAVTTPVELRLVRTWLASLLPATRHLCGAFEGDGWRWWRCGPASHPRAVVGVWKDNIETLAWADSRDALCETLAQALALPAPPTTPKGSASTAEHLRLHLVDEGVCDILASRLPRHPPFLALGEIMDWDCASRFRLKSSCIILFQLTFLVNRWPRKAHYTLPFPSPFPTFSSQPPRLSPHCSWCSCGRRTSPTPPLRI